MSEKTKVELSVLLGHQDLADLDLGWKDAVEATFASESDPVKSIAETPVVALAKALGIKRSAASAIKNTAEGLLPVEDESLKVEMSAAAIASANASAVTAPAPFGGAYAHLLSGASASGLSSAIMNPRIKPAFIKAAANSVLTYVVTNTGVLAVFDEAFWAQMALEDMDLRSAIDEWQHKVDSGDFVNPNAQAQLVEGVSKLFGKRFDDVIRSVAKLSQQTRALQLVGTQANVDIADDAADFASLSDLIPLLAEELSQNMIQSRMPEQANRLVKMVVELMTILKNPILHQYAGVVNPASLDEGAVMFLQKKFGPQIANRMRLAMAYEALVSALAECPSPEAMEADYLKVVGVLAARLNNLFKLVAPDQEVSAPAAPFRQTERATSAHAEARAGFTISFSLSLKRR